MKFSSEVSALEKAQRKYFNTFKGRAARMCTLKKQQCKRQGIRFNLDKQWILKRLDKCALTGIPFKFTKCKMYKTGGNKSPANAFGPSIDRIDPTKGYIKSNCRVILHCVNMFKFTMTDTEMMDVAKALFLGHEPE